MYKSKYFDENFLTSDYNENKKIEFLENILIQTLRKFEAGRYTLEKIDALKALQLINLFCIENNLTILNLEKMSIDSEEELFAKKIKDYLSELIINSSDRYQNPFAKSKYNLSDKEESTIQTLINNLRDKLDKEQNIKDEHKQRIRKKLNEMQEEFNKKISTFDSILGKSMDVLKVLQFARKEIASPLIKDTTNLIKEINKIESNHSGLPSIENQIDYKECIEEVEVIEIKQLENK
jgi:hypothetical protein